MPEIITGERYEHYLGSEMQLLCAGEHIESGEAFVVMRSDDGRVWIVPHENFNGKLRNGRKKWCLRTAPPEMGSDE
jgi:hypothetical protein